MRENGARPDFDPEGSLALKPWFGSDRGLTLPRQLDLPVVRSDIRRTTSRSPRFPGNIGAIFPRQTMKDASGASQMDPKTQVTSLHNVSMLDAARNSFETNLVLALLRGARRRQRQGARQRRGRGLRQSLWRSGIGRRAGRPRGGGNAPNTVLAAACSVVGPGRAERAGSLCDC